MSKEVLTPMMQQFHDLKAKHPDAILLFRCGDFYETYCNDAIEAAQILGITLTYRSSKDVHPTEMAGFPHHALDTYLPKLIRAGRRVAICDQLEDPKLAKKLVKRGITELVTPGVALSDNVLSSKENNFLAAVYFGGNSIGLSLLDISTGEFLVSEGNATHIDKLLGNFQPKEVLVERGKRPRFEGDFGNRYFIFEMDDWAFAETTAREKLLKHFSVATLKGFGIDHLRSAVVAAGVVLAYLDITQHRQISHISAVARIEEEHFVRIDKFTARNLELVAPMNEGGRSLLQVVDRTLTPMGARMLHRWLLFPLRDIDEITRRQEGVEYFFREPGFRELCQEQLAHIGDLERIVSKVAVGRVNPRELQQLRLSLEAASLLKTACEHAGNPTIRTLGERIDRCEALTERIRHTLSPEPPISASKGGVIAAGVNAELDELRAISTTGKDYLMQLQRSESEATGIQSLKIGFNSVFGYYLEVRNMYKEQVPQEWIRKQTLVNAERYITPKLKEYEEKILGAEDKILSLEARIYSELVEACLPFIAVLRQNATSLSMLDCFHSLAAVAAERRYVRPIVDDSTVLDICGGRHPVIETLMPVGEEYVANDVFLDTDSQQVIVITGPNMAGKSALLRQTALITLLAQIGSFVPADSARIGWVDKIFTRVGASDNISVGESTFMVEMSEAASIMNNLTCRSLVLFDELGRGTSTYDGISIAWSIIEYLHENGKSPARTLFATHYHELNEMAQIYERVRNFNVAVKESEGRIVFRRKLVPGGSEHSFGIHVARLAGMPQPIVARAEKILERLEANSAQGQPERATADILSARESDSGVQRSFFQLADPVLEQVRDEILRADINNLTPVEALMKLNEIKKIITGRS